MNEAINNTNQPPLTLTLQEAKFHMIGATNEIMQKYGIPAVLMEGILSGVLSDVRAQVTADVLADSQRRLTIEREEETENE